MQPRQLLRNRPSPFAAELMFLFHLPARDARTAEAIFTTVEVPAGTELAWEGSRVKQLVLVLAGEVEVCKDGERLDVVGPGGVVGEISAIGASAHQTASVRTITPSRIAAAGARDLARLHECPSLYRHLGDLAATRLAATVGA